MKRYIAGLGLVGLLFSGAAFSNIASTEYVQNALGKLQQDLSYQFNSRVGELNNTVETLAVNIITHNIGEIFQGGMVFYVDKSRQHGLMVSLLDISDGMEWRNGPAGERMVNARGKGLGAGEANTRLIVAGQTPDEQEGSFAALMASSFEASADGTSPCDATMNMASPCYSGWYLPSVYELTLLYSLKQAGLGNLGDELYWSSTEASTTEAWLVDFGSGEAQIQDKSTVARIRAIHTF